MQKSLIAFYFLLLVNTASFCQTNVSGGIYSNATWTVANSPYIVIDTVVVFPNVTLTIDPGVTVKFTSNTRLEIRQATLIAIGTVSDTIFFRGDNSIPAPGFWQGIFLNQSLPSNFNYCSFESANIALDGLLGSGALSINVENTIFSNNVYGIKQYEGYINSCKFHDNTNTGIILHTGIINNCLFIRNYMGLDVGGAGSLPVTNCTISNNQLGLVANSSTFVSNCNIDSNSIVGVNFQVGIDSLYNCHISYNGIGYSYSGHNGYWYDQSIISKNVFEYNDTAIKTTDFIDSIFCNKICYSTTYDLYYYVAFGSNMVVQNNSWCTSDSVSTGLRIFDGYDNINLGLVSYLPIDTLQCYLATANGSIQREGVSIYPNPVISLLKIDVPEQKKCTLRIFDFLGNPIIQSTNLIGSDSIDLSKIPTGIYILELFYENTMLRRRIMKI